MDAWRRIDELVQRLDRHPGRAFVRAPVGGAALTAPVLDGHIAIHYSIASITARVILAHRAISRRNAIISAERPPWIVRAWRIRSIPSAVRGPVLSPP
ncbi:MAG: hypothetical protein JO212_03975 [Acetobacteraceae bacterium]|nr:hypothetical protein [Acetobacteraceae bacterium]